MVAAGGSARGVSERAAIAGALMEWRSFAELERATVAAVRDGACGHGELERLKKF